MLGHPDLRALIKDGEPTGLLMTAVMHFVAPSSDPWGLVDQYMASLAPGSYLALSHVTADRLPPRGVEEGIDVYSRPPRTSTSGPGRGAALLRAPGHGAAVLAAPGRRLLRG